MSHQSLNNEMSCIIFFFNCVNIKLKYFFFFFFFFFFIKIIYIYITLDVRLLWWWRDGFYDIYVGVELEFQECDGQK